MYRGIYISICAIKEREPEKYIKTTRLGIAISKKIGKATKRNKIKRRLRVLAKEIILNPKGTDYYYVIITHKSIIHTDYQNLKKDLTTCFKKIG
ncbi:ribonuclease P protein component [Wolbachia endosymbiont of Chironomus riparius]|uniref:ribonuclease P protein component n=1 Tax=Wolbachia endosymbiont of Chironomus riparius TaxID=2883238 RepID=UPI00209CC0C6|nr:ribonuclease P protein component [Wolbachia endosymbiont of Chironomus riparius]